MELNGKKLEQIKIQRESSRSQGNKMMKNISANMKIWEYSI